MAIWYIGEEIFPTFFGHGLSGYMAIAIMGIYIGNVLTKKPNKSKEMHKMAEFCTDLSSLTRILIFVFLGASISMSLLKGFGLFGLLCAVGSVFIARPLGVFIATAIPPVNSLKERIYFALEGPRGVVPAALAAMIYSEIMANPDAIPVSVSNYMPPETIAGSILVATFLTIFLSVVVEASWAYPLANKLFK
jgi:NhaP-type Na+/H+ or K+/H+ antiporter